MKAYYVVFTPFFPSEQNFAGSYIYDQVKAIQRLSPFEVIVLTTGSWTKASSYVYQGITVHQVKLLDLPSFVLPGLFNALNVKKILNRLRELTDNHLENIQFIHGHVTYPFGLLAIELAKKIGAKSIVQHHGFDVMGYTNGRFQNDFLRSLNKKWINKLHIPILNQADWNIGVSQKTLDRLHTIPDYQPTQELVLYNGVDPAKFYPIANLKDPAKFTIGCVGNFWEIKDQLTLIKAVANLVSDPNYANVQLKLIGNGATQNSCVAYVKKHQLEAHVVFFVPQDHTQMNAFYNSLDLFVLPSYDEAFGCVYTEAYACGLPFIGIEQQGIAELVLPENSVYQLVPAKNETALSEKIRYFYENSNFVPKLNQSILIDDLVKNFLNTISKE